MCKRCQVSGTQRSVNSHQLPVISKIRFQVSVFGFQVSGTRDGEPLEH